MIKTEPSKVAIILSDESGYIFNIDAERHNVPRTGGWQLSVGIQTDAAFKTWQDALPDLLDYAKNLVRMLEKEVADEHPLNHHFVSLACSGEFCGMCYREHRHNMPATHKVGEEFALDEPNRNRHNWTQYVCCGHFQAIFNLSKECSL